MQQLGARDDDESSSAGGEKKKPVKRRKQYVYLHSSPHGKWSDVQAETERLPLPTLSPLTLALAGNPSNPVLPVNSPLLPTGLAAKPMTEAPILNLERVTMKSATSPCSPPFQSTQNVPMVWAWIRAAEKAAV